MNLVLGQEHKGKIVRLDRLSVVTIPEGVFNMGDILVLFNNTDQFTTIESKVAKTYRSSMPKAKTHFEFAPRALANIIFVDGDIAVITFGD